VQASSDTGIVTATTLEVRQHVAHLFAVRVTNSVTIPGINALVGLKFFYPLRSDESLSCVFPFSFCRKPESRHDYTRLERNASVRFGKLFARCFSKGFVHGVRTPCRVFACLVPAYTYNREVTETRIAKVMVNVGVIEGQLTYPNCGVGKSSFVNFLRRILCEIVQILEPVDVCDFSFIHVKGGYRNRTFEIVAIRHHILFERTHHCTATFNKYHVWSVRLPLKGFHHESPRIFIIKR